MTEVDRLAHIANKGNNKNSLLRDQRMTYYNPLNFDLCLKTLGLVQLQKLFSIDMANFFLISFTNR